MITRSPYIVALTGGIGSGKSTASELFESLNVPIIDADQIARNLVLPDQPAFAKMIQRWGLTVVDENGDLDRHKIREFIFNNPDDKEWLEQLLHPAIYDEIVLRIHQITTPYCVIVIPLLTEDYARYEHLIDHVIVMDAPEEQQLARIAARDPSSEALIRKIIDSQASAAQRIKIADTVLRNSGSLMELKLQINNLHEQFMQKKS